MPMSPSRLAAWVREALPKAEQFQLYFLSGDDTRELLQTWETVEVRDSDTEHWCERVLALCQDDCNNERELESRYRLISIVAGQESGGRVTKHKPTNDRILEDPLSIGGSGFGNNANDQLRRMNECLLRMYVSSLKGIFDGYKELLSTQSKEISHLREQHREMSEAVQLAAIKTLGLEESEQRSSIAMTKLASVIEKAAPEFMAAFAGKVAETGIPEV